MSPSWVIETEALSKVYGHQRALDAVDLKVAPGAIGLLGPNGAGKSTFMKCLLQLQPITSGSGASWWTATKPQVPGGRFAPRFGTRRSRILPSECERRPGWGC